MRVPAGIEEAVFDLLRPDLQRLKKLGGFVGGQLDPRGAKLVARWPVGRSVIHARHTRIMPDGSGDIPAHWPTGAVFA